MLGYLRGYLPRLRGPGKRAVIRVEVRGSVEPHVTATGCMGSVWERVDVHLRTDLYAQCVYVYGSGRR